MPTLDSNEELPPLYQAMKGDETFETLQVVLNASNLTLFAKEGLYRMLLADREAAIRDFANWHNTKYDDGYESGIAIEHVSEYLNQPTKERE